MSLQFGDLGRPRDTHQQTGYINSLRNVIQRLYNESYKIIGHCTHQSYISYSILSKKVLFK